MASHEGRQAFTSFSSTPGSRTFIPPPRPATYAHGPLHLLSQLHNYDVIMSFRRIFSAYISGPCLSLLSHGMWRDYTVFLANTVSPQVNSYLVFKFCLVVHRSTTKTILPPLSQLSEVFFHFLRNEKISFH